MDGLIEGFAELGGEALSTAAVTNDNDPKKKAGCLGLALAFVIGGAVMVTYCSSSDDAPATPAPDKNKADPAVEQPCPPAASSAVRTAVPLFA
jgi:hypothetical protein